MTLMQKKNKLIQEEINRVKTIMGLTEEMSVDGCVDHLESLDYVVDSPSEEVEKTEKCEKKNILKCVVSILEANNVDPKKIITQPFTNEGKCYTRVTGGDDRGRMKAGNLNFWENGVVNYVGIFKNFQAIELDNGSQLKAKKFQFDGRYKCNPDTNKITYYNFKYSALRDDKNEVRDPYDFEPVDSSGVGVGYQMGEYWSGLGIGESGDAMRIINKMG